MRVKLRVRVWLGGKDKLGFRVMLWVRVRSGVRVRIG